MVPSGILIEVPIEVLIGFLIDTGCCKRSGLVAGQPWSLAGPFFFPCIGCGSIICGGHLLAWNDPSSALTLAQVQDLAVIALLLSPTVVKYMKIVIPSRFIP